MNKRFRFLILLPFFPLLVWTLAVTQKSSADGSIVEEIKALELRRTVETRNKSDPRIVDPKEIRIIKNEDGEEIDTDQLPEWIKPVRWYRSNAAGMALEEVPSRFTVLRNEYALVIDFINAEELPEILEPYYAKSYYIEVRALYHNGKESRRQWIFRDRKGASRVVAVLREMQDAEKTDSTTSNPSNATADDVLYDTLIEEVDSLSEDDLVADSIAIADNVDIEDDETAHDVPDTPAIPPFTGKLLVGFVEIYNENELLAQDIVFSGIDGIRYANYSYRKGTLVRAEFIQSTIEDGVEKLSRLFTDDYRYNRSGSLRFVERIYHEQTEELVRLSFPHRVLDAANMEFIAEKMYIAPEFFGSFMAEPNQRLVFNTDARGRILAQTLFDEDDEVIWTIVNNWKGDRIASAVKTQGDDVWIVEYEYDGKGKRIVERDLHNGVLERLVRAEGKSEVEELMIDGAVVLRAVWEDGRKISEQRVRNRGERAQ